MRRFGISYRFALAHTVAAVFCLASLNATAQTTAAQKAAAAQKAQTAANAQAAAKAQAIAKAQTAANAQAAIKSKQGVGSATATTSSNAVPATLKPAPGSFFAPALPSSSRPVAAAPSTSKSVASSTTTPKPAPGSFFAPAQPAAPAVSTNPVAAAAAIPAAAPAPIPATSTAPAKSSFLNNFLGNGSNAGTASGGNSSFGGSSIGPDSAGRTSSGNTFAAGLGRFEYGDTSAVAYGCLRSDTRVFCDFDEFKQSASQVNAGWAYNGAKLILNGGHIVGVSRAIYVDSDGTTFPTAQLSPNAPVRMMLEFDDVPTTQNAAILSFGNKQIQNVGISPLNLQENGNIATRGSNGQQGGTSSGGQQQVAAIDPAAASATPQSAADKINNTVTNVQSQKSKWGAVLGNLKSVTAKPQ